MDDFIAEIHGDIYTTEDTKKKTKKFRDLFSHIVASSPEITIVQNCGDEGEIVFEVSMKSLGISYETLLNCKNELSSEFAANFIGELLVRENIDKFAKIITNLKGEYVNKANRHIHRRFGMQSYRDKFIIHFHISLIQHILTEDFRKIIV